MPPPPRKRRAKLPLPRRRCVVCCRVLECCMRHASHFTAGRRRRPYCGQTRHHSCSEERRSCTCSRSRNRGCLLRRPPRRRVSARCVAGFSSTHVVRRTSCTLSFNQNSVCASSFFCFSPVNALHCITLLPMATLKLPVFCCSARPM